MLGLAERQLVSGKPFAYFERKFRILKHVPNGNQKIYFSFDSVTCLYEECNPYALLA
jgi:hypothetical protein